MKKTYFFFVLMIAGTIILSAQNNIRPTIYFEDLNFYNPSNIPIDSAQKYYFSLQTNYKFVKNDDLIWNKPPSVMMNHIGKIKQTNLYYFVGYLNDDYSFFNRNSVSGGVAYRLKLGTYSYMNFGGKVVVNFDVVNGNKLQLPVSLSGTTLKVNPDLDLGVEFGWKGLQVGLASKNLIGFRTKVEGEVLIANKRLTSLTASYLFHLGKNFKIAPLAMLYYDGKMIYDVGAYFCIYDYARISHVLRINEIRSIFSADVRIVKNLYLGAAFDFSPILPDKNLCVVVRYGF